jgi:hypothetical protein
MVLRIILPMLYPACVMEEVMAMLEEEARGLSSTPQGTVSIPIILLMKVSYVNEFFLRHYAQA